MLAAYVELFRAAPGLRRFWGGLVAVNFGNEITKVALIWLVYEKTRSAEAVGWLMVCLTGPVIIGAFLAGWALDRFDKRAVMMIDAWFRGAIVALIPILHLLGLLELWHLYAVAAVFGLLMMVPLAGTPALLPSLVPHERLSTANALEIMAFSSANALGPAIGGLLIGWLGAPLAVTFDALTYFIFAVAMAGVRVPESAAPDPAAPRRRVPFSEVMKLLIGNTMLASITLMFFLYNIGAGTGSVWTPVLAREVLGGGPELYGALLAAGGIGQLASAFWIGSWSGKGRLGLRICVAQIICGLVTIPLVVAPSMATAFVALALFGIFTAPLTIWAQTLRMQVVPAAMRGRAFAFMRMLMQAGRPLGGAIGGWAVLTLGLLPTILGASLLIALAGAGGLLIGPLRRAEIGGGEAEGARP